MTKRLSCPPAPGPLEEYAAQFDDRLGRVAQRRGWVGCYCQHVTRGLRPGDYRLRLGTPDQETGSNRRIPCPVTKEPHKPLVGSSNLPLATYQIEEP